jgi:hypothetical protein
MSISLRTRQIAPWLAGLPAIALLILCGARERSERRHGREIGNGLVQAQRDQRRSHPVTARDGALRGFPSPVVELNAEDHLDGLRYDPGYALAWHRQQQGIIERQYGYAIESLNLPDGASAKLAELLTARREAVADARDVAQQLGIVGPQAKVAVQQSVDALTDEIKQLVGDDAYYGHIELAPTISTCKALLEGSIGLDLSAQGHPLTMDQLYSLAEAYVNAVYSPAASTGPQDPDTSTGLTPQFQGFLDKVSDKLTPTQVSAVHEYLVKQVRTAGDSDRALSGSDGPQ